MSCGADQECRFGKELSGLSGRRMDKCVCDGKWLGLSDDCLDKMWNFYSSSQNLIGDAQYLLTTLGYDKCFAIVSNNPFTGILCLLQAAYDLVYLDENSSCVPKRQEYLNLRKLATTITRPAMNLMIASACMGFRCKRFILLWRKIDDIASTINNPVLGKEANNDVCAHFT
jgi:hypothetical protein